MKILVVSPYFPYPTNFGGAFDIYSKILFLKNKGFYITLICTISNNVPITDQEVIERLVDELILVERKKPILYFLKLKPYQVASRNKLSKLVIENKFDYMILEGEYVGAVLDNNYLKSTPFILRLHNNESLYFKQLYKSEKKVFSSIYYYLESILFSIYSTKVIKKARKICCISSTEAQGIREKYDTKEIEFSPTIIERRNYTERELNTKVVLYIGALFTPNNIESVKWYLKNVHPALNDVKDYKFIIVGSTKNESQKKWLEEIVSKTDNVSVYFDVSDLEEFYSNACVFVNPVLNGAGLKIKNLNAISEGLPLVTTTKGNDGTGFVNNESVFIADSPNDFEKCVRKLLLDYSLRKSLSKRALMKMKELYDNDKIINHYLLN